MQRCHSLKKKPLAKYLRNNLSRAAISPNHHCLLQTAPNLYSEVQNKTCQEPVVVGGQHYVPTAIGGGLCGYSEESLSVVASGLHTGNIWAPTATWSFSQSQLNLPTSTEVTSVYDDDRGKMSQGHAPAHSNVQWEDTLPDLKGDLHLFLDGDQKVPTHIEEQVHSKLDQSEGSQTTSPWTSTASYMSGVNIEALCGTDQMTLQDQLTTNGGGIYSYSEESLSGAASGLYSGNTWASTATGSFLQSQFHLPASNEVSAMYDDDPGKMTQGHASAHSSVQWMVPNALDLKASGQWKDTLPDPKGDLYLFLGGDQKVPTHITEQVYSTLDQSEGSQTTAPWTSTASYMSGVNIKALGGNDQMTLQDQLEGESRLDDLMEIIAEEGALNNNQTDSYHFY